MRIPHGRTNQSRGCRFSSLRSAMFLFLAVCIFCTATGAIASDQPAGGLTSAHNEYRDPIPGLDSLASATLYKALDYLEILPSELGFDKLYAEDDTFRLRIVKELLGDPLRVPGWQKETVELICEAKKAPASLAQVLGKLCEAAAEPGVGIGQHPLAWPPPLRTAEDVRPGAPEPSPESIQRDLEDAVSDFLADCRLAEHHLERAFAGITPQERDRLLMLAPAFWGSSRDVEDRQRKGLLHRSLGADADTAGDYTEEPVLDAGAVMDRAALTAASEIFFNGLMRCAHRLSDAFGP